MKHIYLSALLLLGVLVVQGRQAANGASLPTNLPDSVESSHVHGVVTDEAGVPLMGVMIQAASGTNTTSDIDGYFILDVPTGTMLNISCLGYKPQKLSATEQMSVVLQSKHSTQKPFAKDSLRWQMFMLLNGMSPLPFSPAVGLTIGMVKFGGWYVNAMTGLGFQLHKDARLVNGIYYDAHNNPNIPFYTGAKSSQTLSVTAGGLVRFGRVPMYAYMGAGYGYKSLCYKTNNGKWVAYSTNTGSDISPMHSVAVEAGIMANIKGFALSVGYEMLIATEPISMDYGIDAAHELKIGIGSIFNTKKEERK